MIGNAKRQLEALPVTLMGILLSPHRVSLGETGTRAAESSESVMIG